MAVAQVTAVVVRETGSRVLVLDSEVVPLANSGGKDEWGGWLDGPSTHLTKGVLGNDGGLERRGHREQAIAAFEVSVTFLCL